MSPIVRDTWLLEQAREHRRWARWNLAAVFGALLFSAVASILTAPIPSGIGAAVGSSVSLYFAINHARALRVITRIRARAGLA